MGSKKALAGFLVEALSSVASDNAVVLDLMTGSGAAAGAFAHFWPTYASDAQTFCRHLARVQGGGYSLKAAQTVLEKLLIAAKLNTESLLEDLGPLVEAEDKIFHQDFGLATLEQYREFVELVPSYPSTTRYLDWDPSALVAQRQRFNDLKPYCLCTAYFANVYFGLRQAVKIDGLRYAIADLEQDIDQSWALGALTTAVSAVALSYGGHFAQPLIRSALDINERNLSKILERRAMSVTHEFSIRLLNLAEESHRTRYPVEVIKGPWEQALDDFQPRQREDVVVYIDAPYTRDEYSRYYHVLETLVSYSYPSSSGPARMPSKISGERFRSEFFTRSTGKTNEAFCKVISRVLHRGWICAWSYASSGSLDMVAVITEIHRRFSVEVSSYASPYIYKAQGGHGQKETVEYLVIFRPTR